MDSKTKDSMDDEFLARSYGTTQTRIDHFMHPTPHLDPKGSHELTKDLETSSSQDKEQKIKELEDDIEGKEINKKLEILDDLKSKQIAEVVEEQVIKNDSDEMILEGEMQVEEQVFASIEIKKGGYFST